MIDTFRNWLSLQNKNLLTQIWLSHILTDPIAVAKARKPAFDARRVRYAQLAHTVVHICAATLPMLHCPEFTSEFILDCTTNGEDQASRDARL